MGCHICKNGNTSASTVTVTLERDGTIVVFRKVPAQVCETCGEQYVDGNTAAKLLQQAGTAAQSSIQVEVRAFAAA